MEPLDLSLLEQRIGFSFCEPELLRTAMTHRSHAAEAREPVAVNQRLEFLGDAVLSLIVAEWLTTYCPDWQEGTLTKVRSRLTQEAALARVARRIGLGGFLRLGQGEDAGGGREKPSVLADALEALLGALWLDGGAAETRRLFETLFAEELSAALVAGGEDNPKGELQELLQAKWKTSPRYELLEESGPSHRPLFRVAVFHGGQRLGEGAGGSRREAEVSAAREALGRLRG